jgi:nucleoside-triphosphatase
MDELGRFELGSPAFLAAVGEALDSSVPVVGVLKAESNPFLDSIRARPDTAVIDLDQAAEARFAAALTELLPRLC